MNYSHFLSFCLVIFFSAPSRMLYYMILSPRALFCLAVAHTSLAFDDSEFGGVPFKYSVECPSTGVCLMLLS